MWWSLKSGGTIICTLIRLGMLGIIIWIKIGHAILTRLIFGRFLKTSVGIGVRVGGHFLNFLNFLVFFGVLAKIPW